MAQNTAIVCEFNPLHNGHKEILAHAAGLGGAVIAVMSGNFTQRSEAAVFDKYKRAHAVLLAGADAVLELPFPWCSGGGEFFASGAVAIAQSLGIDRFVFGSETGDTGHVKQAADVTDSPEFAKALSTFDVGEVGTAAAYSRALETLGITLGSNDRLAAEYIRASRRMGGYAEFEAYRRMTDPDRYRSATCIRDMLEDGAEVSAFMPPEALQMLGDGPDIYRGRLAELIYSHLRLLPSAPSGIFDAEGGVAERLWLAAGEAETANELFTKAATKKYTDSRLRRAALYSLLGVTEEMIREMPRFTVLLGANGRGRDFLSSVRRTKGIAVLTKPSSAESLSPAAQRQYELWRRADELYSLCLRRGVKRGEFLRRSPVII